jgi:hypothetical protein
MHGANTRESLKAVLWTKSELRSFAEIGFEGLWLFEFTRLPGLSLVNCAAIVPSDCFFGVGCFIVQLGFCKATLRPWTRLLISFRLIFLLLVQSHGERR